ncbi:hypothetical protein METBISCDRAFT_22473 [Metschnikowia bicuspidata]|uniref:Uncharacterized protein n=1 Tax=Metschnikowia bicuspidata TaxID=27322 RepID=A0A4P9ZE94_9ASCO|nr:hypothetical protein METBISCDRAFT_22473 [Metschnikowia bicuspidata]
MSVKKLVAEIGAEINLAKQKAFAFKWKKDLADNKARLAYEKLRLIKARLPVGDIDQRVKKLDAGEIEYPDFPPSKLCQMLEHEGDVRNVTNVVIFLRNQRVYNELLERYNLGLTMTQEDNVRMTAKMVGLAVPEN